MLSEIIVLPWFLPRSCNIISKHLIIKKETSFTTILLLHDSMIFEIYWNILIISVKNAQCK